MCREVKNRIHFGGCHIWVSIEIELRIKIWMRKASFRRPIPHEMDKRIHLSVRWIQMCCYIIRAVKIGVWRPTLPTAEAEKVQQRIVPKVRFGALFNEVQRVK
jgi:hypothetical protein